MAERGADGDWRKLTYGETLAQVRCVATALRARGLSAERPLMILSGNDLDHAVLGLAALYASIPYVPLSPAYSLISRDFGKLRHIVGLTTPGLVFAADGDLFGRAIEAHNRLRCRGRGATESAEDAAERRFYPICSRHRPIARSMPRMMLSGPTRSRRSSSPRARPACRRA